MHADLSVRMKSVPAEKKPHPPVKPAPPGMPPAPQPPKKLPLSVFFAFPEVPPIEHPHQEPQPVLRTYRALDTVRGERDAMLSRLQYPPHQKNAH